MALFITQCPHCQTTFRTSVSQLQSADGMVRCGACLKVFVADDNLIPSADLQTKDIPMSEEQDEGDELAEPSVEIPEVPDPVFTLETVDANAEHSEPTFSESGPHWEIIDETTGQDQPADSAVVTAEARGTADMAPGAEADPLPAPGLRVEAPAVAQALQGFSALDDDFTMLRGPGISADGPAMHREHLEAIARAGDNLEIDWHETQGKRQRSAWWSVSAFLLVAALAGQMVSSQWYELGQNYALRPWLERICDTFPCTLSPMADLQALRSDSLVVRSHAEIANALNVTLIFRNESAFDQVLPVLNLHFMNADNELIAARQFTPDEYLPATLADMAVLPAGAPVQVSFDIIDPGIEAINYEVSFGPQVPR
jgi:predicted Zn finger-like uncharacterized protein